jgi:hypothetical protein
VPQQKTKQKIKFRCTQNEEFSMTAAVTVPCH